MQKIFVIEGMNCPRCVRKVETSLARLPGVEYLTVTLDPPRAILTADREINPQDVDAALRAAGHYRANS